jgi:UTP--glucose-1-phosphate uridylyltransferase
MVEPVPEHLVCNYGVADVKGHKMQPGESVNMTSIVEKPDVDEAPSNLTVVGRYVLPPEIWEALEYTPQGAGDEIQLTDAIAILMKQQPINAYHIIGRSHDCGNKLGYMKAFVEYGLRDKQLAPEFRQILLEMVKKYN